MLNCLIPLPSETSCFFDAYKSEPNFIPQMLHDSDPSVRINIQSREFNPHQNLISIFATRAVGLMSELPNRLWVKCPFTGIASWFHSSMSISVLVKLGSGFGKTRCDRIIT